MATVHPAPMAAIVHPEGLSSVKHACDKSVDAACSDEQPAVQDPTTCSKQAANPQASALPETLSPIKLPHQPKKESRKCRVFLGLALGLLVLGLVGLVVSMKIELDGMRQDACQDVLVMPWNQPDFPVVYEGDRSEGVYTRKDEGTLEFELIGDVLGSNWEKTIRMDGNETLVVVMDLTSNLHEINYIESTLAVTIGIQHMQAHGARVLGAASGCMESYSSTQAFKNGEEALEFCRSEGLHPIEKTSKARSDEFYRWYYAVKTNAKSSFELCSKDQSDLECKAWNTDRIVDGLNRTAQIGTPIYPATHYVDLVAAGYQSISCPQDDGITCFEVPQCEVQCTTSHNERGMVIGLEENGQCWCWNGSPGFRRQQNAIDQVFDQSRDVYAEDLATAHCFAKKHGIRNIVMIGGDAMACVMGRPVGLYEWLQQGYRVYVVQDLLLNTFASNGTYASESYGQILNSYVYGVYAGMGVQVVRMPMP